MKSYPSIPHLRDLKSEFGQPCISFLKYDGSNLRWEWSKKRGWYKFGSRTRLFDASDAQFAEAVPLFMKIAPRIEEIIKDQFPGTAEMIVFTEFFGKNSFSGTHVVGEEKQLKLFDVNLYKQGIMLPRVFLKLFKNEPFAAGVYTESNLNQTLIDQVREDQSLNEGVVCKGVDKRGKLWMTKIKTRHYLERLRNHFGVGWEKHI